MSNPTLLWKSLTRNQSERNTPSAHISAAAWQQHFLKEFSEPDSKVEYTLKCDLNRILSKKTVPTFIVSLSDIMSSAQKIKKPFRGVHIIFVLNNFFLEVPYYFVTLISCSKWCSQLE